MPECTKMDDLDSGVQVMKEITVNVKYFSGNDKVKVSLDPSNTAPTHVEANETVYDASSVLLTEKQTLPEKLKFAVLATPKIMALLFCVVSSVGYSESMAILCTLIGDTFGTTNEVAGLGPGICIALTSGAGLFGGCLINKIGTKRTIMLGGFLEFVGVLATAFTPNPWFIAFSLGVITGLGCCFTYLGATLAVSYQFQKNTRLLMGFLTLGIPLGILVYSQLLLTFECLFTWRGALMVISAILLNIFPCGLMAADNIEQEQKFLQKNETTPKKIFDFKILKNTQFLFVTVMLSSVFAMISIHATYFVDYIKEKGLSKDDGVKLVSSYTIGCMSSRIAAGMLMAIKKVKTLNICVIGTLGAGLSMFCFTIYEAFESLVIVSVMYGISLGMMGSTYLMVLLEVTGQNLYCSGVGFAHSVFGITIVASTTISGKLSELTFTYRLVFALTGGIAFFLGLTLLLFSLIETIMFCIHKKTASNR